jgi:ADP-heptose:LPS heptosyltransferase
VSAPPKLKSAVFSAVAAVERALLGSQAPLAATNNFLLLQYPAALGTAVHATPMIPALRTAMPGCRIAVAASGLALDIFANNHGVDWLIETPSPLKDLGATVGSLRHQLPFGGERFAALTTMGNERTRIGIAALLSGRCARVGFTEVPQIYSEVFRADPARSLIDNNLRIVEAFGHPFRHFEPQIFFAGEDLEWARQTLAGSGVRNGQMIAVFVTQTSVTQRKSWRAERFQAAARHMIAAHGAHIVFVGTAAESPAIESLREGLGDRTTSVAGKTSLLQLTALLSLCRVGLTLDTGILHLGRAVGLPMAIIAPAWSPPTEWLPLGNPRYRILKNADMATCPPHYMIDEISVEEATAALDDLVAKYPSGAATQAARSAPK